MTSIGAKLNATTCLSQAEAAAANITIYLSAEYNATIDAIGYQVEPVTEYWE